MRVTTQQRILGGIAFTWPASLVAAVIAWCVNPWFMDQPSTYAFFAFVPLVGLGFALGHLLRRTRRLWIWGLGSGIVFGSAILRPAPPKVSPQLVVIGMAGADWEVADPLELPHLDALKASGTWGTLRATAPLHSAALWNVLATGKAQGQQANADRFWERALGEGRSVGMYKWPLAGAAPESGAVFWVNDALSGVPAETRAGLSWLSGAAHASPGSLVAAIPDGIRWSTLWAGLRFSAMEQLSPMPARKRGAFLARLRLRIDRDVFVAMLQRNAPDLAVFVLDTTAVLARSHWGVDGGRTVDGAYRLADAVLGDISATVDPLTPLIVLSNHGFRNQEGESHAQAVVPRTGALHSWLEQRLGEIDLRRVGRTLVLQPAVPVDDGRLTQTLAQLQLDGVPLFQATPLPREAAWALHIRQVPPVAEWKDTLVGGLTLDAWVKPARGERGEPSESGIVLIRGRGLVPAAMGEVSALDAKAAILDMMGLPSADSTPGWGGG